MGAFEVTRSTHIDAPPERVQSLIEDFHEWRKWSPWEEIDPDLQRGYTGAERGPGAHYAWEGNRKAGKGHMEILESSPQRVAIRLTFEKPWKATNQVGFHMTPSGGGTDVTWSMTGEQKGLAAIFAKVMPMDKMVGKDMEKGLQRMKAAAETVATQ
jgi:uncharacterized protein YndB with AHSA1/START domain